MAGRRNDTPELFRKLARVVAPPPELTVSQWADLERRLSSESSAEPGQWRTDRAPYQREMLDAINDPATETVVVMTSSQVGKTEIILNIIGYHIHQDPAPIMVIQPTLEMAQAFSKDRLAPMIRDTPALHGKVADSKARDSGNTLLHKTFAGGHITLVGANSPSGLASRPIRILLADEVDRFPVSAGTEGDPLSLARKRLTTFWNRKEVDVSTPTIKGTSRIETAYEGSSKERWNLPCPSCGEYQPLVWAQIVFDGPFMACQHCGVIHKELEWKAGTGKWVAENPGAKVRGFHLNELASPWKRWETIIEEFKEAKRGGRETLKVWINTTLGETWEEEGEGLEADALIKRRQRYDSEVPNDVVVLTAGVDVQDNRLEYEVVGWGLERESWGIRYGVIMGDPGHQHVWSMLDAVLEQEWLRQDRQPLKIVTTCVDSGGHHTKAVYDYCKPREIKRVWAIKGQGGSGVPFIQRPKKRNAGGVWLFSIGVDVGKDTVVSRLKEQFEGPGYCHFPIEAEKGYDQAYFDGLTSEHRVVRYSKGRAVIHWEKRTSGARNEPFDLRNYATAAFEILNPPLEHLHRQLNTGSVKQEKAVPKRRGVMKKGVDVYA